MDGTLSVDGTPGRNARGAAPATPDIHTALRGLFNRNYVGLCRLAVVVTGQASTAEDVVMESFEALYSALPRLDDPSAALVYLRRTVVNKSRTARARSATEQRAHLRMRRPEDQAPDAHDVALTRMPVLAAVHALPERQRAAVGLYFYADLSVAEIAAILGCRPGTVKSQLAKARRSLSVALADLEDPVRTDD